MITRKNCMEEIANIFDVKLGQNFIVENEDGRTIGIFSIDKNGLWKYEKDGLYYDWDDVMFYILKGMWGIRKMTNEEVVVESLK